ncbi:MAG: Hsp20/alpha crystallin family protein [Stigonema ocellatum SAG 48.90 = DSM 106950]|nr:Hsp20/alpha crystallin family protein [Stigonema ocellatum SAG 48.90 = DSM 106950]
MMIVRYNPWQEFNSIQRQMNRLFDDALSPLTELEKGNGKFPAAELHETADAVHLKLEVPGIEAKDLDVQVTENAVAITGERKSETKTEDKGRTVTEFHYGKFQRVIPLPARIQNTSVTAEYKDGILNLTLPKAQEEKNKVVKVNLA